MHALSYQLRAKARQHAHAWHMARSGRQCGAIGAMIATRRRDMKLEASPTPVLNVDVHHSTSMKTPASMCAVVEIEVRASSKSRRCFYLSSVMPARLTFFSKPCARSPQPQLSIIPKALRHAEEKGFLHCMAKGD